MWHALRKAAELARADRAALPFNFDLDPAFENDEAFIALFVEVESGVLPALVGVVESDLEPVGLKADFVRGLTA
jgi:hypothetical protein